MQYIIQPDKKVTIGIIIAEVADMDHLSNILGQIVTSYMNAEEMDD